MISPWRGRSVALAIALLAMGGASCDQFGFLDLCKPGRGANRSGFYSTGDCFGTDASVFRGHEFLTEIGNADDEYPGGMIFPQSQIELIVEGNRHTDYPIELLVHLDNGVLAYLDALLGYHNAPENQAPHFILRAGNSHYEAHEEALDIIRAHTIEAAALWNFDQTRALIELGQATHALQDSYSPAHTVRSPDPGGGDLAYCICKLKTFVPRDEGCLTSEIEFHDKLDDDRKPGHTTALDSIYLTVPECLDPGTVDEVKSCLTGEARRAVLATHDYLVAARELLTTGADQTAVLDRLDAYFAVHFSFCVMTDPPPPAPTATGVCDRPPPEADPCPG
jgi:hypothetical protein